MLYDYTEMIEFRTEWFNVSRRLKTSNTISVETKFKHLNRLNISHRRLVFKAV